MTRDELSELQRQIDSLRDAGEDYLIIAVGVRGPNIDCTKGNAVATVRMGNDEATSEAVHLQDAIALARGKIIRERERREAAKAKKEKATVAAIEAGTAETGTGSVHESASA